MKRTLFNSFRIVIPPFALIFAALVLLSVPIRWVSAAVISSLVHELCHILAIRSLKLRIHSVYIGIGGARMDTEPMTDMQELLCALAGPFGGLCLLLLARWIPRVAICAAFQSLYNLLPIYPSDGGRILRCCARLLLPERFARRLCGVVEAGFLFGVAGIGVYGTFCLHLGLVPILVSWLLIMKVIKIPCKPDGCKVQ